MSVILWSNAIVILWSNAIVSPLCKSLFSSHFGLRAFDLWGVKLCTNTLLLTSHKIVGEILAPFGQLMMHQVGQQLLELQE